MIDKDGRFYVFVATLLILTLLTIGFVKNRARVEHMQRQLDRIEREVRGGSKGHD